MFWYLNPNQTHAKKMDVIMASIHATYAPAHFCCDVVHC